MAIYHFSVKIVSRGKGQSVVAKASYNSREKLTNERTGERHDFRNAGGVSFSGVFAPKNAPAWASDREKLWSEVEKCEKRKNSQLAREIEVALPHELTDQQREWLLKDFVRENFVRHGMVADASIHAPSKDGDTRNYHAHILLTMREIGPDGFGDKMRHLNTKAQLEIWRDKWEHLTNRHLERHGHDARIDRRTLEAQGIDREPTVHNGVTATQLEREGIQTERGDINRSIEARNLERKHTRHGNAMAAALYDQADMVSMQHDAMRHLKDARREWEKQKTAENVQERQPGNENIGEDKSRNAAKEKTEHKRATTERTDYKQRMQALEDLREIREKLLNSDKSGRDRDDDFERERSRER